MDRRIIEAKLERIRQRAIRMRWPIEMWQARTADHLMPGVYQYDEEWTAVGRDTFWPAGKTLFIRREVVVPEDAPLGELRLVFEIEDLEGLLRIDGRAYAGIDVNHTQVALPANGSLNVEAEFICVPRSLSHPELRTERARLRGAQIAWIVPEIEAMWYDLRFYWEASEHCSDDRRRSLLHAALEDALLAIDLTAPDDVFSGDISAARAGLQKRVAAIGVDPEGGRIFLTGHSHIDTAWLWPLAETVRKVGRTWSTACRLMERYPDYHFSCSQPQLYAYARDHYPELYEQVKDWIQSGRWECTGPMWVESDCNVPSGESLIRQILYGVEFLSEEFGVRPRTCWLPDVFGYPASLPGILRGCGIEQFMTSKLHWQARNPFPMHLFWWEGIDGSRVLASIPRLRDYYNGSPNPEQLRFAWDQFNQRDAYPEVLFPFGYGDGGGGPTEEMLEFAGRAKRCPGVPECRQGAEEAYFEDVRKANPELPTWVGELYLETHRGTYTTQARTKQANRRNELLLRDAEIFGTIAGLCGADVDIESLRPAWHNLLLLQFHDILPGSSIGQVYEEAALEHAQIAATATRVRDQALQLLARGAGQDVLVVFNSLSWDRSDVVSAVVPAELLQVTENMALEDRNGEIVPLQVVDQDEHNATISFCPQSVGSIGAKPYRIVPFSGVQTTSLHVSSECLENRFFRIELDPGGNIDRLLDKRVGREVVSRGSRANELQLFQDGPEREAAWNVHDTFEKKQYEWDTTAKIEVKETGPVQASVRVTRRYRESVVVQDIVLYDTMPRIDFVTRADWQARQVPRATYEIQFGAVERPTHRNTSWDEAKFEVCAHRWADLSEAGYGVSLLNDCKYGYDVKGNVLRLTLLRGAEWPDPDADRGSHEFTYSLLPHTGDWVAGQTVRRAWELNAPMVCVVGIDRGGTMSMSSSYFTVNGPAILETIKPAEDGDGLIVRLYEPHGGRGGVRVKTPFSHPVVTACNHVEEDQEQITTDEASFAFQIRPFEVRTFRLRNA